MSSWNNLTCRKFKSFLATWNSSNMNINRHRIFIKDLFKNKREKLWNDLTFYTSTKSWRGYIFTPVCLCVCVSVCLSVCVSGTFCEQNSSRMNAPIWTRFSLNGCFSDWLGPYWIWWPWVKGQGHSDVIPIFSS